MIDLKNQTKTNKKNHMCLIEKKKWLPFFDLCLFVPLLPQYWCTICVWNQSKINEGPELTTWEMHSETGATFFNWIQGQKLDL